jgi:hypothetical protein
MRPSVVLLGFVLGSIVAITFGLGGVAVVFLVLRSDYPRFAAELPALLGSLGLFAALTAIAGASFYGQLRARAWRHLAVAMLAIALLASAWYYWPV